jgi:2-oxoglutarate ferredoxin oxidoreductase subunit alpha
MNHEYSILVGGQAGDGIRVADYAVAKLFNRLGYWIFAYNDYQSLIRGGHNFSIVRAAEKRIEAHKERVNIIIAMNQETVEKHYWRLDNEKLIIFDSNNVKADGLGLPLTEIVKNRGLPPIARNSVALGALASALGLEFSLIEDVIRSSLKRSIDENITVAKEGYEAASNYKGSFKIPIVYGSQPNLLLSGNEAVGLGAVRAGLKLYVAYPMTPSTPLLHYLASNSDEFGIRVVQPENEIAAIGIAQGAAYAGIRTMVGTSGGGFCLMVEHLSLAGQAEIPILIIIGERPGPAIGLPTYHAQGELLFSIFAGHGEFPRIVASPGDPEEAFYLSAEALNLAWKFQVPAILLADYCLLESTFSTILDEEKVVVEDPKLWTGEGEYKRYLQTETGVSPLAFPGMEKAVVKSNSYEHDEFGITTEDPELTKRGAEKRLMKSIEIENDLRKKRTVKTYGNPVSQTVLITWGSTKGAVAEIADKHGLSVIQPLYLNPLPVWEIEKHLSKAGKTICVEANSTGQLARWMKYHGFRIDKTILKYDGRPFTTDYLEEKIREVVSNEY